MALDGSALDVVAIKKDFPILEIEVHDGKRLVYLDSASSSQKPRAVLDAMDQYYMTTHANIHRGVYAIAEEATAGLRALIAHFDRAETPYRSRPRPDHAPRFTDYAHLARVKEWSLAAETE